MKNERNFSTAMNPLQQLHEMQQKITLLEVMLLICTANNPYDRDIAKKISAGEKLTDGEYSHIFSEASRLSLTEQQQNTLTSLHMQLQQRR